MYKNELLLLNKRFSIITTKMQQTQLLKFIIINEIFIFA